MLLLASAVAFRALRDYKGKLRASGIFRSRVSLFTHDASMIFLIMLLVAQDLLRNELAVSPVASGMLFVPHRWKTIPQQLKFENKRLALIQFHWL